MTADDVKAGDRIRVKDLTNLIKKVRGTLGTVGGDPQPGWCIVSLDVMGGKEFAFDYDQIEPAPAPSPDTPEPVPDVAEDREGLRETIARAMYASYFASEADENRDRDWSRWASDVFSIADAVLPIIDSHTAKAISRAVLAQDSALEVALRERDEARAEVSELTRAVTEFVPLGGSECFAGRRADGSFKPDLKFIRDRVRERDEQAHERFCEAFRARRTAEAALAAEQSAHAETRKALEAEREACAEVMDCLADREDHYAIAGPTADVAIRREREGAFVDAARVIRARAALSDTQEKAHG